MSSTSRAHPAWDRFFERHLDSAARPPMPAKSKSNASGSSLLHSREKMAERSAILKDKSQALRDTGKDTITASTSLGPHCKPIRSKSARNLRAIARGSPLASVTRLPRLVTEVEYEQTIKRMCKLVLMEGVPSQETYTLPKGHGNTPPRALIWKLLLDVRTLDPIEYLALVAKGPSPMHEKICNDASRTLATDPNYKERVDKDSLIRILDAFVWKYRKNKDVSRGDAGQSTSEQVEQGDMGGSMQFGYVQGMNVLVAPFLYVMPSELEAFACFCTFIEKRCPTYVQPTLAGVHRAMELLDRCLQMADSPLASHLRAANLGAELYAFASVLTLCACTPPLKQLLELWDYLLAFGTHLCVPCVVAQLLLMRDDLMSTTQPMKLLRSLPDLEAPSIVGIATTIVRDLDEAFYDELVRHATEL